MLVDGSNHRFSSVSNHSFKQRSSASSFSRGVRQETCIERFSVVFCARKSIRITGDALMVHTPLRRTLVLFEVVKNSIQKATLNNSHEFGEELAIEVVRLRPI